MSRGIIAVDVDLTVADSDLSHWAWLERQSNEDCKAFPVVREGELLSYNLGDYFDLHPSIDSMDYWRSADIYNHRPTRLREIQPIKGSREALRVLSDVGWEIIFVSHVKGNHHKSKVEWLKRHFPFMDGFVATKEKKYVACDIFIDDRNNHLVSSKAPHKIKFKTPYEQDVLLYDGDMLLITDDWLKILHTISKLESEVTEYP